MGTLNKSIYVTEKQKLRGKSQITSGHFGNESEVIQDLIRERQTGEQKMPEEIMRNYRFQRERKLMIENSDREFGIDSLISPTTS